MPNPPQLNELLHWAVENTPTSNSNASTAIAPLSSSTQTDPIPLSINFNPSPNSSLSVLNPTPKKLDTGILDAILGRSDALRIRESIEIFEDVHQSLNLRTQAGEHLEELVEDLDNANGLDCFHFDSTLHQSDSQIISIFGIPYHLPFFFLLSTSINRSRSLGCLAAFDQTTEI